TNSPRRTFTLVYVSRKPPRNVNESECAPSRPFLQRHIMHIVLADVDLLRPEDAVVLQLFQPVRQPTDDASNGEDRREQVARDADAQVDAARVEIDVRIDALGAEDAGSNALHFEGQLIQLRPPHLDEGILGQFLQNRGARIFDLVDAMPQAHDLLFVSDGVVETGTDVVGRTDLVEHVQHLFVGAAVQRAGERADGGTDHRIGIGQRRAGDAAAERRGVHRVFGVQNQASVEYLADGRRWLLLGEHVIEVRGVAEVIAWHDRGVAMPEAMKGGDDGGQLGDEPHDRIPVALLVVYIAGRVEHAQGGN